MGDASDSYVAYKYLTTGRIVEEACAAPGARLSCHPECDNSFSALDRFGRVVDQKWYDHGASEVRDRYRYGYDRAGNRLYRENTTTSGKDEFYGYDAINRLIAFDRGDLNAGKTAISGTPVREEDWNLDPLGNWPGYVQKTSGTTDLDQSRTHNKVNEITAIAATTGTDWADPVHDRAGNMTTIPKPASPADALSCQYDAWNRLVEVMDGQTLVGQYRYDGLNRRIRRYAGAPDTHVHYFYNSGWQVLETRQSGTQSAPPETVQPKHQYAWSLRYIDAPILRDENTDADGLCDDERLYYLGDANFNVTALVNRDGEAVERYGYEPYGEVTFYDEQWVISGTESRCGSTHLYTGREYDPETGLYHYRNRYYNPGLGAFLSRDPIGYKGDGPNLYRYVDNRPILFTDPSGNRKVCCKFSKSQDRSKSWVEELDAADSETGFGACARRASGTFTSWYVLAAFDGPCVRRSNQTCTRLGQVACVSGVIAIPSDPSDAIGTPVAGTIFIVAGIAWLCTTSTILDYPIRTDDRGWHCCVYDCGVMEVEVQMVSWMPCSEKVTRWFDGEKLTCKKIRDYPGKCLGT